MFLIVDKNEEDTNPEIVKRLKKFFSNVVIANLPHRQHGNRTVTAGDINIPLDDGSVLAIERKTPEDFLQSIATRHIFDQIEVMAQNAKYSAVIITGYFQYTDKTDLVSLDGKVREGWRGSSVRSAMNVIQYSGCALIFCPENKYPEMVAEVYNTVNKPEQRQGVIKNRIITFPPVDSRIEFLCQLPGIGITLADSILTFAGMMDNNADEDGYGTLASALHWITILMLIDKDSRPKGWGQKTTMTIRKFFGLESDEYITMLKDVENVIQSPT